MVSDDVSVLSLFSGKLVEVKVFFVRIVSVLIEEELLSKIDNS